MIFLSFAAGVTGPVYALLFYGINTTTIEVKFPYIKEKSDAEFIGNVLLQSVIAGHGIIGYIGIEVAMNLFSDIIIISPEIVAYELKKTGHFFWGWAFKPRTSATHFKEYCEAST